MDRWADAGSWVGGRLRREAFFFPSAGVDLYGSLYASVEPARPLGVVVCGGWGVEGDRWDPVAHGLALTVARLGGAGLVFHYPGFGDSAGDLAAATLDGLATAAVDALGEAAARSAATEWLFAGLTLGASVACLAHGTTPARGVLLMQPQLRPSRYFEGLRRRASRAAFGADPGDSAFGYPIPPALADGGATGDEAVEAALASFDGRGASIRYEEPAVEDGPSLPERIEEVVVPGRWRFASNNHPGVLPAAKRWLEDAPLGGAQAGAAARRSGEAHSGQATPAR